MKRYLMILAVAVTAFGVLSCDKDRTPNGGRTKLCEVSSAAGYFTGVGKGDDGTLLNYDTYLLTLQTEGVELVKNGYAGVGAAVLVDLNTPTNGGNPMRILQGDYGICGNGAADDYCFYLGDTDTDGKIYPSYLYYRASSTVDGIYYPVSGGSISVKTSGSTYDIAATFTTSAGTFVFNYSGQLPFYDNSEDDGDTTAEIDVSSFKYGYAYHYGLAWEGLTVTDYADWYICLGPEKGFDPSEDVCLCLDILTAAGYKEEIPVGKYEYIDDVTDDTAAPFKLVPGFMDEDQYCFGTWYYGESEDNCYGATGGYVTVSQENGKYRFVVHIEDSEYNGIVSGDITLETLEFSDESSSVETTAAVRSSLSAGPHRAAGKISLRNFGIAKPRDGKSSDASIQAFIKSQKRGR